MHVNINQCFFKAELGSIFSKNRIFFKLKTSFHQLSNMASSGLQKMLTFIILCDRGDSTSHFGYRYIAKEVIPTKAS